MKVARRSPRDKTRPAHRTPFAPVACPSPTTSGATRHLPSYQLTAALPVRPGSARDASKPTEHGSPWEHVARLTPGAWRGALAGLVLSLGFTWQPESPALVHLAITIAWRDGRPQACPPAARAAIVRLVRLFLVVGARAIGIDVDPFTCLPVVQHVLQGASDAFPDPDVPPPIAA